MSAAAGNSFTGQRAIDFQLSATRFALHTFGENLGFHVDTMSLKNELVCLSVSCSRFEGGRHPFFRELLNSLSSLQEDLHKMKAELMLTGWKINSAYLF